MDSKKELMLDTSSNEYFIFTSEKYLMMVLGGIKLSGLDKLRVTLKVVSLVSENNRPLRNSLDLYNSDQLDKMVSKVVEQFQGDRENVSYLFEELINKLEKYRIENIEGMYAANSAKQLSEDEQSKAIAYLKQKSLINVIQDDIGKSGVIGEENNRLLMYLIFTSRKLDNPLHVINFGASGEGKTYLQEKVSALIPEEDKIELTALTKNALYYFSSSDIDQKLILIEDLDGVEEALYPIRELQSKHRLSKAYTIKDAVGNMRTLHQVVEGKVSVSSCTTKDNVYEDNANRAILLQVNSSKEQDEAIVQYQSSLYLNPQIRLQEYQLIEQLKNVQRVLQPVRVINPFASSLRIPSQVYKPRRMIGIYLSLIEGISFIHQYQRKRIKDKSGSYYIETTASDIALANTLLKDVLVKKSDLLSIGCRGFLEKLKQHLIQVDATQFITRDIRGHLRINASTLKKYLKELTREGFINKIGGDRYSGYTYRIMDMDEFKLLSGLVAKALETQLEQLSK